jgi:hypothetical protein
MKETFDHAHLAIFDSHGGLIETKGDDILSHLRYVFRPGDELRKSHNLLSINAFKVQGVDFEYIECTTGEAIKKGYGDVSTL